MATTTDFMSSLQSQFLENVRRGQEAVIDSIGLWAESFEKMVPDPSTRTAGPTGGRVPSAEHVIDNSFDFAAKLLEAQRQFAKSLIGVTASGMRQATSKAQPERPARKPAGS